MLFIVLCSLLPGLLLGEHYCYSAESNPYRGYATKTPYREILDDTDASDEIPGCTASRFWILARHGSRYPGDDDIAYLNQRLPQILSTADLEQVRQEGLMCEDDIDALQNWRPTMRESDDDRLSTEGNRELFDLAKRFQTRFPELLTSSYDEMKFEFRHTDTSRTEDSAKAFAEGLFGSNQDVNLIQFPEEEDWLLRYYKNCEKYIKEVDEQPNVERDEFESGSEMSRVVEYIETHLGLPADSLSQEDFEAIFDACIFEYAIYGANNSSWCALFPEEIAKIIEYLEDLEYYYEDGYGHEINYEQACVLLNDVYDLFTGDSPLNVITRFGHSANINTLLAHLGLFNDDVPLRGDNYDSQWDREWRTSLHTPMASNIGFIQYACPDAIEDTITFKVLVNEKPVELPAHYCNGLVCRGPMTLLRGLMCEIDKVCEVEDDGSGGTKDAAPFHTLFCVLFLNLYVFTSS